MGIRGPRQSIKVPNMRKYQIECALLNNYPFENYSHASGKIQFNDRT